MVELFWTVLGVGLLIVVGFTVFGMWIVGKDTEDHESNWK